MHPSLWCTKMFWSFPKLAITFFWSKYHNFMVTIKNKYFNQNTLRTLWEKCFSWSWLLQKTCFFFFNHSSFSIMFVKLLFVEILQKAFFFIIRFTADIQDVLLWRLFTHTTIINHVGLCWIRMSFYQQPSRLAKILLEYFFLLLFRQISKSTVGHSELSLSLHCVHLESLKSFSLCQINSLMSSWKCNVKNRLFFLSIFS